MTAATEIQDAKNIARQRGYVPEGFIFEVRELEPNMARYTIVVTLRGVTIEYQGGQGMNWWNEFDRDLREGWKGIGVRTPA